MKSLFFGVVLILLIGFGGFFYRNVAERGGAPVSPSCTEEAKICPDGSVVGRTDPICQFAPCAFPNVEVTEMGVSFVVPAQYSADERAYGAEPTLVAAFVKPSMSPTVMHSIIIRRFHIPEGQTADDVILTHTRYQPSDVQAEDFERFETVLINGKQYRTTVIERFEGIVHSAFFLARGSDILMFEVIEHDVAEWTSPELVVLDLPEQQALLELLGTLQSTP